jgi:hypothetical protein
MAPSTESSAGALLLAHFTPHGPWVVVKLRKATLVPAFAVRQWAREQVGE